MKYCGYEFEGPFEKISDLRNEPGIYIVLCMHQKVLYVGTSGEGMNKDSQGVQERIKGHNRKSDWMKKCNAEKISYAAKYVRNQQERLSIEEQLQKEYALI